MKNKLILVLISSWLMLSGTTLAGSLESSTILRGEKPFGEASPAGDAFGSSLAEWNNWVFVGAVREASNRIDPQFQSPLEDGAIYIYKRNGRGELTLQQTIKGNQQSSFLGDRFGAGVLARGGFLFVVSANGGDFGTQVDPFPAFGVPFAFAGAVDVYKLDRKRQQWVWQQQLSSPSPRTGGSYGGRTQSRHLAATPSADMLVVAEPQLFPGVDPQLHTYIYDRTQQQYELTQSIVLEGSNETNQVLAADSIINIDPRHFVITVSRVSLDETGTPLSATNSLQVFKKKGSLLKLEPVQVIEGETTSAAACDQVSSDITGLASARGRVAFAQPCALGGTGRVDIYKAGKQGQLNFEASIEGELPGDRLGASLFGGQESLAFNQNGRQLVIGTSGAVSDPQGPGARNKASVWQLTGQAGWRKVADLNSTSPDALNGGFGSQVLFLRNKQVLVSTADGDVDPLAGSGEVGVFDLPKSKDSDDKSKKSRKSDKSKKSKKSKKSSK